MMSFALRTGRILRRPRILYLGTRQIRTICRRNPTAKLTNYKNLLKPAPRRHSTTLTEIAEAQANEISRVEVPTSEQLRAHFLTCAVPMFGFGLMDNTVMIQAGNAIDCTLGVTFGLSTLAAAACGQIVANGGGVIFGGYVERMASKAGLPVANLRSAQIRLPIVKRVGLLGSLFGVVAGAALGLVNLWFIDTNQSAMLKIQAIGDQEFDFEIEASNSIRSDGTTVTVKGPDVDGMLASVTQVLTERGYSLVEVHASPRQHGQMEGKISSLHSSITNLPEGTIEDTIVVRPRGEKHKKQVDDDELDELAKMILAACKDPLSAHTLKAQVTDLESTNMELQHRVKILEKAIEDRQIRIVPASMH
mmetsp:Transcript_26372/g.40467  ORF Transcript_26372/g.40467 Transcript_26372/m.40467 type:complete len:363 (-) Transcript_26372:318-1406(-)|eukprot:CAMPEP_0195287466 /NCGR_PEP_ID=MMETSP0707-20130614/4515_1 /TAXON_ID=33640 /ORGANISM="Asterionellopsis glacialis, Strain CCMP134" /LENGTH=362 /DNA_ID=CAMNT_0040347223 /DNA_START=169 /DNA_END=1257 /DNA_ORIENTATION=+